MEEKGLNEEVARGMRYANDARLAAYYERHLVGNCHYRTPDVVAEEIERLVGARKGAVFLDLGAGTGLVGEAAHRRGLAVEMWALDVSEAMLELIDSPIYVVRRRGDAAADSALPNAAFDGVVAAGLLEHVVDPTPIFQSVARWMKPGGGFVFTFPPNEADRTEVFDREDALVSHPPSRIRASLGALGLDVTREAIFPAYERGPSGWVIHHLVAGRIC